MVYTTPSSFHKTTWENTHWRIRPVFQYTPIYSVLWRHQFYLKVADEGKRVELEVITDAP